MIRTLAAAALVAAALSPAAHAATSARCDFGPQIGTACLRDPMDHACPILEGQTVFGIKCADANAGRTSAAGGPYCAFHPICDKVAEILDGSTATRSHTICHRVEEQAPWLVYCHD